MQEDRAAGRERQRVRDCVPVFWSVCSFFLRLLCVHVCVCVRECVGVYVFACLHSLRVTQEETAAPILVILTPLPFLPDCPSVHIFTTRNRFPAGSKFKWANCTFTWGYSKQWADSVCVCVCMEILTSLVLPIKGRRHGWKWYGGSTVFEQTHKQNVLLIPVQLCCPFEPVSIFINYQSVSELRLLLNLAQFVFVSSPTI